jgi:hypothetical protein
MSVAPSAADSRRTSRTTATESPRSPAKTAYGRLRSPSISAALEPDSSEDEHVLIFTDLLEAVGISSSSRAGDPADAVAAATVLRLNWLNLSSVGDGLLGAGSGLRDLYLGNNRLSRIEGLDSLANLEFLALGGNRIRAIEGVSHLRRLLVLDLSDNLIEALPPEQEEDDGGDDGGDADADAENRGGLGVVKEFEAKTADAEGEADAEAEAVAEAAAAAAAAAAARAPRRPRRPPPTLPRSIRIFKLSGNPVAAAEGYRERALRLLPACICLDNVDVVASEPEAPPSPGGAGAASEGTAASPGASGAGKTSPASSPLARDAAAAVAAAAAMEPVPESAKLKGPTSEEMGYAVADLRLKHEARRAEIAARYKGRAETEHTRATELAQRVHAQGEKDVTSARDALVAYREGAVARSKERAEEQARRTASTLAAMQAAAEADALLASK